MKRPTRTLAGFTSLASLMGCASNKEASVHPVLDTGKPMQEAIYFETGQYEEYTVEITTYQSKVRFPDTDGRGIPQKRQKITVRDVAPDGALVAELSASTRFGTEQPFIADPRSCFPRGHPFASYTSETFEKIYKNFAQKGQ